MGAFPRLVALLMAGFPEIHRMGHGRVFGVVSGPDVQKISRWVKTPALLLSRKAVL